MTRAEYVQCDGCPEKVEGTSYLPNGWYSVIIKNGDSAHSNPIKHLDLCGMCYTAFCDWLANKM